MNGICSKPIYIFIIVPIQIVLFEVIPAGFLSATVLFILRKKFHIQALGLPSQPGQHFFHNFFYRFETVPLQIVRYFKNRK